MDIFGKEDFYIEFMFHGMEEEAFIMPMLETVSEMLGTRTIFSNDVCLLENSEKEVLKNQIIRSLKNNMWTEPSEYLWNYYMKSEEELKDSFIGFLSDKTIDNSMRFMNDIADNCTASLPEGSHYPQFKPENGMTSSEYLGIKAKENISRLFAPEEWTDEYKERLENELKVIQKTGYSDYTLIISEILEEGRKGNHDGEPGTYIGPGRGCQLKGGKVWTPDGLKKIEKIRPGEIVYDENGDA